MARFKPGIIPTLRSDTTHNQTGADGVDALAVEELGVGFVGVLVSRGADECEVVLLLVDATEDAREQGCFEVTQVRLDGFLWVYEADHIGGLASHRWLVVVSLSEFEHFSPGLFADAAALVDGA